MRIETTIPAGSVSQPAGEPRARAERDAEGLQPERAGPSRGEDRVDLSSSATRTTPSGEPLSQSQIREVEKLEKRDAEVRTHEQAHVAAAGALFRGGPNYDLKTGPDGKRYAVGGSVQIDTSEGSTPEETITKAQQIRRAALAPAEPSSTDRSVAAKASRMEAEARAELVEQQAEEANTNEAAPEAPTPNGVRAVAEYERSESRAPALDTFA